MSVQKQLSLVFLLLGDQRAALDRGVVRAQPRDGAVSFDRAEEQVHSRKKLDVRAVRVVVIRHARRNQLLVVVIRHSLYPAVLQISVASFKRVTNTRTSSGNITSGGVRARNSRSSTAENADTEVRRNVNNSFVPQNDKILLCKSHGTAPQTENVMKKKMYDLILITSRKQTFQKLPATSDTPGLAGNSNLPASPIAVGCPELAPIGAAFVDVGHQTAHYLKTREAQ